MTERDEPQQPNDAAGITRRDFINKTAVAGAGVIIVPRHVLGRGMQAPSDTFNIATVGVGGMGSSNTNAVMSQNIVAFCDVDFGLLDTRIDLWKNPPLPRGGTAPQTPGQAPAAGRGASRRRRSSPRTRSGRGRDGAANSKRFVEQQLPKIAAVPRLPRDAREAEGHRRGHRRDARSHARRDRDGGDGSRQARLRAEAAVLVGRRSAATGEEGEGASEGRRPRWATRATRATKPAWCTSTSRRARSARCAKCTCGPTVRSATGRRACRVRRRCRAPAGSGDRPRSGGEAPTSTPRLAAALRRLQPSDKLAWDLFLGVAPPVDYHPIYHPFNWRGWVDWGQGALGDMGAHLIDHPFWSLKLGIPTVIETRSTPFNGASFRRRRRPTTSSRRAATCRP